MQFFYRTCENAQMICVSNGNREHLNLTINLDIYIMYLGAIIEWNSQVYGGLLRTSRSGHLKSSSRWSIYIF